MVLEFYSRQNVVNREWRKTGSGTRAFVSSPSTLVWHFSLPTHSIVLVLPFSFFLPFLYRFFLDFPKVFSTQNRVQR